MDMVLRLSDLSISLSSLPLTASTSTAASFSISPSSRSSSGTKTCGLCKYIESFIGRIYSFRKSSSAKHIEPSAPPHPPPPPLPSEPPSTNLVDSLNSNEPEMEAMKPTAGRRQRRL